MLKQVPESGREDSNLRPPEPHYGAQAIKLSTPSLLPHANFSGGFSPTLKRLRANPAILALLI